jgi:hypothetical protein
MPFLDKNKLVVDVQFDAISFVAGSDITGVVRLVAIEDFTVRGIYLSYEVLYSGVRSLKITSERQLLYESKVLFGAENRHSSEKRVMGAGAMNIPFRMATSNHVPPTMMQFADSCGRCIHRLVVEAVIPYSFQDKRQHFEINIMRGVHPTTYLTQRPRTVTQNQKAYHCGNMGIDCREWCCRDQCQLHPLNSFQLTVYRNVISLLNDRFIPFTVSGHFSSRFCVALVRSYYFRGSEVQTIVSRMAIPRQSSWQQRDRFDGMLPLQFEEIGDAVTVTEMPQNYLSIRYFVAVFLYFDEGVCPSIIGSTQQRIPVTLVHCIHERAPYFDAASPMMDGPSVQLDVRDGVDVEMATLRPPNAPRPMGTPATGAVVYSPGAEGVGGPNPTFDSRFVPSDIELIPSAFQPTRVTYTPPPNAIGYHPVAPPQDPAPTAVVTDPLTEPVRHSPMDREE